MKEVKVKNKYLKITIAVSVILLLVATTILLIFNYDSFFTENTIVIVVIILCVLALFVGAIMVMKGTKHE